MMVVVLWKLFNSIWLNLCYKLHSFPRVEVAYFIYIWIDLHLYMYILVFCYQGQRCNNPSGWWCCMHVCIKFVVTCAGIGIYCTTVYIHSQSQWTSYYTNHNTTKHNMTWLLPATHLNFPCTIDIPLCLIVVFMTTHFESQNLCFHCDYDQSWLSLINKEYLVYTFHVNGFKTIWSIRMKMREEVHWYIFTPCQ